MNRKIGREAAGRSPANMVSHQRATTASFCDYNGTLPVGMYSTLMFYLILAKNISEYGYMSRDRAFFKWYIGYIGLHRADFNKADLHMKC